MHDWISSFFLTNLIIFNDPTKGCRYLCPKSKWDDLPQDKSLFHAKKNCGLPIGNLTSQIFANFYMSLLDHYIKHDLGIRWYGRYVDDFFLVHNENRYLKECCDKITCFVEDELRIKINQIKTYLQRCDTGVGFLGVKIEKAHINSSRRTIGNFQKAINELNAANRARRLSSEELGKHRSRINSYLGILSHYNTFRLRLSAISRINSSISKRIRIREGIKSIRLIR